MVSTMSVAKIWLRLWWIGIGLIVIRARLIVQRLRWTLEDEYRIWKRRTFFYNPNRTSEEGRHTEPARVADTIAIPTPKQTKSNSKSNHEGPVDYTSAPYIGHGSSGKFYDSSFNDDSTTNQHDI